MNEIYTQKEWLELKQILKDRKQGKYPGIRYHKFMKTKEEKINETRKSNHQ